MIHTGRTLIAGIGNIFLGDDGFGVEVVRRLSAQALPEDVRVADFGIRGIHLVYELLDGQYDTTILVDATPRGGEPGTVYLIEPDPETIGTAGEGVLDAHDMTPDAVLASLRSLGGKSGRVLVVGCEPADTSEQIGLSQPVVDAVEEAIELILDLLRPKGASMGGI